MLAESHLTRAAVQGDASHCGATREWVDPGAECCTIQQGRRREEGEVSIEVAVGARPASVGSLAAVDEC
jgi:hypothetical protein